jgi:hypothetical protein
MFRLSRCKEKRSKGDPRSYRLPKNTRADDLKIKNLRNAGERFMDAFAKRPNSSSTEE